MTWVSCGSTGIQIGCDSVSAGQVVVRVRRWALAPTLAIKSATLSAPGA